MTDVKGYRPLTDDMNALANEGREIEERYIRWLERIEASCDFDGRSLALGKTHIQTGTMWAIRAIFQPGRVDLPEDAEQAQPNG